MHWFGPRYHARYSHTEVDRTRAAHARTCKRPFQIDNPTTGSEALDARSCPFWGWRLKIARRSRGQEAILSFFQEFTLRIFSRVLI
jgi:hypothetical protein